MASGELFDQPNELVSPKTLSPGELHEVSRPCRTGTALWGTCHSDPVPPPKLEQSLVSEKAQRSKHGVGVHTQDRSEITSRRSSSR